MNDKFDRLNELYSELGAAILERFGPGKHEILVYARAGDMWVGVSIYHNEGDRIAYSDGVDDIADIVRDIWYAEPADKRWQEMQFDLNGAEFHAQNFFAEELNQLETYIVRRERAVKERFGDKPIYYPPWPDEEAPSPDIA